METLLALVTILLCIGMCWGIDYVATYHDRERLKKLAAVLGGEVSYRMFNGVRLAIQSGGYETYIRLYYQAGEKDEFLSARRLRIEISRQFPFKMKISSKRPFFRKATKTGDFNFDNNYYLFSSDPMSAMNFIQHADHKEIILRFFRNGFTTLKIRAGAIYFEKEDYTDEDLKPDNIRAYADSLCKLATN